MTCLLVCVNIVTFYTVGISVYMLHIACRGPCRVLRDQKNNNCFLIAALSPGGRVCRVSPWGRCVCIGSLSSPMGAKHRFILQSYWLDKQSLVLHQAPAAVSEPFIDDSGKFVQPVSSQPTASLYRINLRFVLRDALIIQRNSHGSSLSLWLRCWFLPLFLILYWFWEEMLFKCTWVISLFKCFSGLPRNSRRKSECQI